MVTLTEAQIEAGRSPKGGWTRAQLAQWGVPWPPPKGWRNALTHGRDPKSPNQEIRQPVDYSDDKPRLKRKTQADFLHFPLAKYWFAKPYARKYPS